MELKDDVIINGKGASGKLYTNQLGKVYDIAEGTTYPITVELANGEIDSFSPSAIVVLPF